MFTLTIRKLGPAIKDGVRAARNARSLEAGMRAILTEAVSAPRSAADLNPYDRIRARIELLGGSTSNVHHAHCRQA